MADRGFERGRISVIALLGFVCLAVPTDAYRFYSAFSTIPTSAAAIRWDAENLPLRFRMLDDEVLPEFEDLDASRWRQIILGSFDKWTRIPESSAVVSLDGDPHSGELQALDGTNAIGFSSDPDFEDASFAAYAAFWYSADELKECDIVVNPFSLYNLRELQNTITHEVGHCLGLAHSSLNPLWIELPRSSYWEPYILPEGVSAFQADPAMSYGTSFRSLALTPDDEVAISLLYPSPGFVESRGAVGGRVVLSGGDPAPFVYVQSVDYSGSKAKFGVGTFTDEFGHFTLEGLRPGAVQLWVHPILGLRAHSGMMDAAAAAGALDLSDTLVWADVRAGERVTIPPIEMLPGRTSR